MKEANTIPSGGWSSSWSRSSAASIDGVHRKTNVYLCPLPWFTASTNVNERPHLMQLRRFSVNERPHLDAVATMAFKIKKNDGAPFCRAEMRLDGLSNTTQSSKYKGGGRVHCRLEERLDEPQQQDLWLLDDGSQRRRTSIGILKPWMLGV
jgi:hypothetical protein